VVFTVNDLGSGAVTDWPNPKNDINKNNTINSFFINYSTIKLILFPFPSTASAKTV
jgi:hypothetical protein